MTRQSPSSQSRPHSLSLAALSSLCAASVAVLTAVLVDARRCVSLTVRRWSRRVFCRGSAPSSSRPQC